MVVYMDANLDLTEPPSSRGLARYVTVDGQNPALPIIRNIP